MVRLLSISIFAIVTSLAAAQKNPQPYYPQPYYPPNWYSDIQSGLRLSKDAEVILRNDTRWAVLTERWTPWSRPETVANIEAATVDDVRNVVNYAMKNKIVFMIRNSGHGFTKTLDESFRGDGLQLSLAKMNKITVDSKKNTITVQGGVKNWQVIDALWKAKKRTSVGSCDCVSYLGIGLGGGHGRMQGLHGLVIDNFVSAKVILSSGQVVTTSATQKADLFWALRGAGHNYGVVVEATFRIYDPRDADEWMNADYLFEGNEVSKIYAHINRIRPTQPDELTVFTYMQSDVRNITAPPVLRVSLQYGGKDQSKFEGIRKPFLDMGPYSRIEKMVPWNKINEYNLAGKDMGLCIPGPRRAWFSELLRTYNTNDMVASYEFFTKVRSENPTLGVRSVMLFESYPQKAFKAVKNFETAYPHRDMNILTVFMVQTEEKTNEDDEKIALLGEESRQILRRSQKGPERIYVNYAFGNEGASSWYWAGETWRKLVLQAAKLKYDPFGVFSRYNPVWP